MDMQRISKNVAESVHVVSVVLEQRSRILEAWGNMYGV